jgi:hypothetical protein
VLIVAVLAVAAGCASSPSGSAVTPDARPASISASGGSMDIHIPTERAIVAEAIEQDQAKDGLKGAAARTRPAVP